MRRVALSFEAGTLVLVGIEAGPEPPAPGFVWDARVLCWRGPAWRYREALTTLVRQSRAGAFELEDTTRKYTTLALTQRAARAAFEHQRDAVACWKTRGMRGVVVLPTGAGKSYVAELAMCEAQRSTLVVAPTLDLMNQWYEVLHTAFGCEVGLLGGGYHEPRDITVATYDSAALHMERHGNRWGLLIFDEVHHLPSPTFLLSAELSLAPFRLGLTATLERSDGREALLDERVGPVVYARGIKDLAGEYLAEYDVETVFTDLTEAEAERYAEARGLYKDFLVSERINMAQPDGWRRFIQVSSRSAEGRRAFMAYREQKQISLASQGKLVVLEGLLRQHARDRTIIFTNDNDTVYRISRAFLIPAITHQTDLKERRQSLERFNAGAYPCLVTSRVLNEGVNVPAANVAVVLSGTASVREHVQRLGRILRRQEGKRALLYEVITRGTVEERQSDRRREHDAYR
ncbi:MAG: DEAD/DEAH box helicase family protein [Myxococcales bacterium]|nr:DEAD/DEAH box helicase family protein [Myxococcales bacterium]